MNHFVLEDEIGDPQWAYIRCVHRAAHLPQRDHRIQRVGIDSGAGVRHFHAVSVIYGIRLGRFRLKLAREGKPPVQVLVGEDEAGRPKLIARDETGADLLATIPPCDHPPIPETSDGEASTGKTA